MVMISFLVAVATWLIQNSVHEGSHLLVAYVKRGWKPLAFKPYPCNVDGRWYFAYCRYDTNGELSFSGVHIAPMFAGLICATTWLVVNAILLLVSHWHWLFLFPVVAGIGDALFFWWGYLWGSVYTDGKKYKYLKGRCDD